MTATGQTSSAEGDYEAKSIHSGTDRHLGGTATAPANTPYSDEAFLVFFTGDDDPRSPRSMAPARKWLIVTIMATTSLCVACTSSLYSATSEQIEKEFHVSSTVATLGLSLFVFGLGLSPMILAPMSEFYGRKWIYVLSTFSFVVWLIPCAVAKNIETLIVARFFNGLAGAAFLSVAGGTVGDLFPRESLQAPMMLYTASPL
jgi:MFS family permease